MPREPSPLDDPRPATEPTQVTALLSAWRNGDEAAGEDLVALLYDELRRLARRALRDERSGHTLQATELVNEAYLRLVRADIPWQDRGHFYSVASRAMRRILVDHARAKARHKRGGEYDRVTLDEELIGPADDPADLLALDQALNRLAAHDARKARAVELRYFGGLPHEDIAGVLGVSTITVHRDLRMARAWLYTELS